MAQVSKRLKRARRERRYISLMERDALYVQRENRRKTVREIKQQLFNTNLMLLSVLSQAGGEVTVTQGTFQQVVEQGPRLGWQSGLGPTVEGQAPEFIVRVVTQEPAVSPVQDTVPSSEDTPTEDSLDGTPI